MVAQHGKQHRQREVSVVHAALLAALAVNRVYRPAGLDVGHHSALAGNDPEEHVGTHGGGHHGAHQQKSGAPGKPVASQPGGHAHQHQHTQPDQCVAVFALTEDAADAVVQQPEHHQERQRRQHCGRGCPVHQ